MNSDPKNQEEAPAASSPAFWYTSNINRLSIGATFGIRSPEESGCWMGDTTIPSWTYGIVAGPRSRWQELAGMLGQSWIATLTAVVQGKTFFAWTWKTPMVPWSFLHDFTEEMEFCGIDMAYMGHGAIFHVDVDRWNTKTSQGGRLATTPDTVGRGLAPAGGMWGSLSSTKALSRSTKSQSHKGKYKESIRGKIPWISMRLSRMSVLSTALGSWQDVTSCFRATWSAPWGVHLGTSSHCGGKTSIQLFCFGWQIEAWDTVVLYHDYIMIIYRSPVVLEKYFRTVTWQGFVVLDILHGIRRSPFTLYILPSNCSSCQAWRVRYEQDLRSEFTHISLSWIRRLQPQAGAWSGLWLYNSDGSTSSRKTNRR